jgi:hypothetical protein
VVTLPWQRDDSGMELEQAGLIGVQIPPSARAVDIEPASAYPPVPLRLLP